MRYEKRNNLGFLSLLAGMVIGCISLLIAKGVVLALCIALSLALLGTGFYMMTRAFTDVDVDHPDFEQYQQRVEEAKKLEQQRFND